jgi:hypothetical protein
MLRDWLRFLLVFSIYFGAAVAIGLVLASV